MTTPNLIAFSGKAGAGKTTLAEAIIDRAMALKIAMADPLTHMVVAALQMANMELEEVMHYLQEGKDEIIPLFGQSTREMKRGWGDQMRDKNPQIFVRLAEAQIEYYRKRVPDIPIIIDDIRMQNEAEWVKDMGGALIHIDRPKEGLRKVTPHKSEDGYDPVLRDMTIQNDRDLKRFESWADTLAHMYDLEPVKAISPANFTPDTSNRVH